MSRKFFYTFRMAIKHVRPRQFSCISCRCAHHSMRHISTPFWACRHQTLQCSRRNICPRRLQPLRQSLGVGARLLAVELLLDNSPQVLQQIRVRRSPWSHRLLPERWQIVCTIPWSLFLGVSDRPILHENGRRHLGLHFPVQNVAIHRRSANHRGQSFCQNVADMVVCVDTLLLLHSCSSVSP